MTYEQVPRRGARYRQHGVPARSYLKEVTSSIGSIRTEWDAEMPTVLETL
jgi:hypothetical protein